MKIKYYDVDEEQARRAMAMWSFSEYRTGSETEEYKQRVNEIYALGEQAIADGVDAEKVESYCERFAKQYAEWKNKSFAIELRCPSVMISGPANFPVRKKEKQNAARDKHMELYKQIFNVKDKLESMANGTEIIKSSDDDAVERLENKVKEAEALQAEMKAANAWYRKHKTMAGYKDMTDDEAARIDAKIKEGWDCRPYSSYKLTNNNAKIKNAKARLEGLVKVKSEPVTEKEYKHFKAVRNTELMRLQLIFEGKPSDAVRTALKSNGYRWAPKNGAWQRQLTDNAIYSMKYIEEACETEDGGTK